MAGWMWLCRGWQKGGGRDVSDGEPSKGPVASENLGMRLQEPQLQQGCL